MKKYLVLLAATGLTLSLGACRASENSKNGSQNYPEKVAVAKVVYYDMDGKTELEKKEAKSTKEALEYMPQKEGYEFEGWYVKPDLSKKLVEGIELQSDMKLYAGFSKYQEDVRSFVILGNGKSEVLKSSNWGAVITDAHKMIKEDAKNSNLYKLTVKLEEGDEFQFAINGKWENQRGYGYLTTAEKDGVSYFKNSGGLGDVAIKRANIKVAKSGTYTFILKTHPAEDTYAKEDPKYSELKKETFNTNPFDSITWEFIEN
ncbi:MULTISPECIES: InlB B-repeat-containing protein [Streptococcus]|uniref:InlB B-repeat-containing protein n=1 Tax=Streptococcus ruminantium TaxID=1917441 RepID=A0A2Z5TXI8_9STRE|nr:MULTISPECIES: InlB B-repeat-containing protein [Streptococcus]MDQ8759512.1 InlB B-repeat-containing protein [Streptococcus ruminantium]MDQ8765383.1 InlB B-repeat-containing protein [Streptococcus ruminantium]MDQ8767655.1 InlB B-repeat-containing protein [Streptococcus ruminantium]MDQ8768480.1 InlB B-repeat-containing protein [Streptococcus ruminantium]MDQ8774353.1 InlB B-repeat-containing protein [Streptococcus ruminantium]